MASSIRGVGKRRGRKIKRLEGLLRERNRLMNQAFGARDRALAEADRVQADFNAYRFLHSEVDRVRKVFGVLGVIASRGFLRRAWWAFWSMRKWVRGVDF